MNDLFYVLLCSVVFGIREGVLLEEGRGSGFYVGRGGFRGDRYTYGYCL